MYSKDGDNNESYNYTGIKNMAKWHSLKYHSNNTAKTEHITMKYIYLHHCEHLHWYISHLILQAEDLPGSWDPF